MVRGRYLQLIVAAAGWITLWHVALASPAFQVIHRFHGGKDGRFPEAGLAADHAGNFYGTTGGQFGGPGKVCSKGCGNAYSVTAGAEQNLYSFKGKNGDQPHAPLLVSDQKLFGTTMIGGTQNSGTVFELTRGGRETVLHDFCSKPIVSNAGSCADGANPAGKLIADGVGNFYGTTGFGGANSNCYSGCGTVFRVGTDGSFALVYSFCGQADCSDGEEPADGLVLGSDGYFYGASFLGGTYGGGVIFKLAQDGSTETVLYSFCSAAKCADGADPHGDLIFDGNKNIYGTTESGGSGSGVVFKLSAPEYSVETVLYRFKGGGDGSVPAGGVIRDGATGNLYGITVAGGGSAFCDFITQGIGCGTVFEVTPAGTETLLHRFRGSTGDGAFPAGSLLLQNNYLYGTASLSGDPTCRGGFGFGCGTIFKLPSD